MRVGRFPQATVAAQLLCILAAHILSSFTPRVSAQAGRELSTHQGAMLDLEPTGALSLLVPEFEWFSWYGTTSGFAPDSSYFGAYSTLAVSDKLFIGLGTARPAEADGALLAQFDGTRVAALGVLSEQGLHEMVWDGTRLHIAGTDPCCGDDWRVGNHYTYEPPGVLVKHRSASYGLRNVIHTWGLWVGLDKRLYAATSS